MLTRMQQRRGTAAEWADSVISSTVILAAGEVGLETDTGKFKIGNGTSVWSALSYYLKDSQNAGIYAKLAPSSPSYSQNITGINVFTPQSSSQTPIVVSGVSGQSAVLQRWRDSADLTLASIDQTGKLTAKGALFNAEVNVNSNKITNVAAPINPADATNKQYVDDAIQITAGSGMTKTGNTLDVIGTANRITANADSIDIASTYVGQSTITTLGTITTGTWNATAISTTKGGIPTGGTTGQVLAKIDGTAYNTQWVTSSGGSASNSFATIATPSGTSPVADSATDTLTFVAGSGISITGDATADSITIASTVTAPNTFSTIAVPSGTNPVADSTSDTLTLAAGSGITITGNSTTDTVTIAATGGGSMPDFGYRATNAYYGPSMAYPTSSTQSTANRTFYTPFYITGTKTFDRIAIRTEASFSGTSTIRLGVYNNSNGAPSTVKFDAGTVSCTAANTQYDITISQTLTAGWYWFAVKPETVATTNSLTSSATIVYPTMGKFPSNGAINFISPNWYEDAPSGAFQTAGSNLGETQTAPFAVMRAVA